MEYAEPPRAPPISYDFDSSGPPQTAFFGADGMQYHQLRQNNSGNSKQRQQFNSPHQTSFGDNEPPRPMMFEEIMQTGDPQPLYGGQSQSIGQISSLQTRKKRRMGMSTGKKRSPLLQRTFDDPAFATENETDYAEALRSGGYNGHYGGVMSQDEEEQTVYSKYQQHQQQQQPLHQSSMPGMAGATSAGNHQEAAMLLINSYEQRKSQAGYGGYGQQPTMIYTNNAQQQYHNHSMSYDYNLPPANMSGGFGFSEQSTLAGMGMVPNTPLYQSSNAGYQPQYIAQGRISDSGSKFLHNNFQNQNKTYRVKHLPQVMESPGSQAKQGAKGVLSNNNSRQVSPMSNKYNNPKIPNKQVTSATGNSSVATHYKKMNKNLMMYDQSQMPDYIQQHQMPKKTSLGVPTRHRRGGQPEFVNKLTNAGVPLINKSMLNDSLQSNTLDNYQKPTHMSAIDLTSPRSINNNRFYQHRGQPNNVSQRNAASLHKIDQQQFQVNRAKLINTTRKISMPQKKFQANKETNMLINNLLQLQRNSQVATNGMVSQLSRKLNKQTLDTKSSHRSLHSEQHYQQKSVSLTKNGRNELPQFKSSPRVRQPNVENLKPRRPLNISMKKNSVDSVHSSSKRIAPQAPSISKMEQSKHLKDLLARNNLPRQPIILEKKRLKKAPLPMQQKDVKPQIDRLQKLNQAYKFQKQQWQIGDTVEQEYGRVVSGNQRRVDNNAINRQEVIRSVESMRQVKTANGKSRPKKSAKQTNQGPAGASPKTRKSRKSDSKASRNDSFDRSKSKEAIAIATRENSVSSHCKCSPAKRDYNTLHDDSVENCPIHTGGSDYSGGGEGVSYRSPNQKSSKKVNHHRSLKQDSVSTDNRSMKSLNPSVRRFKHRLREAEKKFIQKKVEKRSLQQSPELSPGQRKGYEQPIGCVNCPRCLRKMLKVDAIYQAKKMRKQPIKKPPWDDSTGFHNNQFKDAIKELTKKRSVSQVDLKKTSNFSLKDLPKYSKELRGKSALGKNAQTLQSRLKDIEKQNRKMKDQNKWEFLRNQCMLQQSDWYKSNLYQLYVKHGRQMLSDPQNFSTPGGQQVMLDSVYTEVELRYYVDFLEKMAMKKYRDDFNTQQEMGKALEGHNIKSYSTLRWLMKLISFDYYYERILFRYQQGEQEKIQQKIMDPNTIHNVIKIMVRSLQMYETIDQIFLIFQLIGKIDKMSEKRKNSPPKRQKGEQDNSLEVERLLSVRLLTVIKQLVNNNKFLQKRFIFKGVEMIDNLVKRIHEINQILNKDGEDDFYMIDDGGFSQEQLI